MIKYLANVWSVIWKILEYIVLLAMAVLILTLILLSGAYGDLKTAAENGLSGKAQLTAAASALKAQNWSAALNDADQAHTKFTDALSAINKSRSNPAIKGFGVVRDQIDDLDYLLQTGEIISRSIEEVVPIIQKLADIRSGNLSHNFNDLAPADKTHFLQLIYESEPEVAGLKANLDLATLNLNKIHKIGILWPVYSQISNIQQELTQASAAITKLSPALKLLPALAGYPQASHFLLILQNNDELRPTGGFIGTYGLLSVQNGGLVSLSTDDSYHVDMPASLTGKWNLAPPVELKKYLNVEKWYLRDANWSPDWPQSARQIVDIYNGENFALNQPTTMFTGVIAITPDLVADLIKLVGPITVNGTTYNAADFQPLLQYNVEVAYKDQSISSWDRKDIINSIVEELKKRLFSLSSDRWEKLLSILDDNISKRNIQMYFFNTDWENLAESLGADGAIAQSNSDYLMVVDANLASYKSDAVLKKNLSYALTENAGGLSAAVKLDYAHQGKFDWRTTRYRSYTRVYAPLGSQFISLSGTDKATEDFSVTADKVLNKTVFGFFFTIEPGSSREVTLTYSLPKSVYQQLQAGQYQLLVQKQAGQRVDSLSVNLNTDRSKIKKTVNGFNLDQSFKLP
jgi:hypothetical protein